MNCSKWNCSDLCCCRLLINSPFAAGAVVAAADDADDYSNTDDIWPMALICDLAMTAVHPVPIDYLNIMMHWRNPSPTVVVAADDKIDRIHAYKQDTDAYLVKLVVSYFALVD